MKKKSVLDAFPIVSNEEIKIPVVSIENFEFSEHLGDINQTSYEVDEVNKTLVTLEKYESVLKKFNNDGTLLSKDVKELSTHVLGLEAIMIHFDSQQVKNLIMKLVNLVLLVFDKIKAQVRFFFMDFKKLVVEIDKLKKVQVIKEPNILVKDAGILFNSNGYVGLNTGYFRELYSLNNSLLQRATRFQYNHYKSTEVTLDSIVGGSFREIKVIRNHLKGGSYSNLAGNVTINETVVFNREGHLDNYSLNLTNQEVKQELTLNDVDMSTFKNIVDNLYAITNYTANVIEDFSLNHKEIYNIRERLSDDKMDLDGRYGNMLRSGLILTKEYNSFSMNWLAYLSKFLKSNIAVLKMIS